VQCSNELSRSRYRCLDDAYPSSASTFRTDYSESCSHVWARVDLNLTNPGSPSEPLLSYLDGIRDFGQRRGVQFVTEATQLAEHSLGRIQRWTARAVRMVRCNPGTRRQFPTPDRSSSNGWSSLCLDSCPYLVLGGLLPLGLFDGGSAHVAGRDRIHSSPATNHSLLHDNGALLPRTLLLRAIQPDLWRSRAPKRSGHSGGQRVGPLQAHGDECLANVQSDEPVSHAPLRHHDSRRCTEALGE